MTLDEAINVLNDYDINFERNTAEEIAEAHEMAIEALEQQQSCENCCNGNQEEKAKLCQKSYIAGMEHNYKNEQIIRIKKGTLKARTGRYVIYDVEWLKTHFNTTEAKIYGQPSEDCISKKAVLDALHRYFADGFDSDKWWNSTYVLGAINEVPSAQPNEDCISRKLMHDMGATCIAARNKDGDLVALGALDVLPSATPQPKTEGTRDEKVGHWEWTQYDSKPNFGNWHCSECCCILRGAINGNPIRLPKYCPECGAKMQEVDK